MTHRTNNAKPVYETAIIGGGPAGLTLACLLGRAGVSTICLDQGRVAPEGLRTTAIAYGSRRILEQAGIWERLKNRACPIRSIEVRDGDSPFLLNLNSGETDGKTFGWVILNSDLRAAMLAATGSYESLDYESSARAVDFEISQDRGEIVLQGGERRAARLIVGADGRNSFLREWMDVRTREWSYRSQAILCAVIHEKPHRHAALEHFRPEGPLAILPMPDDEAGNHRSTVILTERTPGRRSLMRLNDAAFEAALAGLFPARYGDIRLAGPRAAHPLGFVHASSYIGPRMALIADAAHGLHPVAAQGLNLGLRDVAGLADLIVQAIHDGKDPGTLETLENYQRIRRPDNTATAAAMDSMVRLFESEFMPVRILRRTGMKLFSALPHARRAFLRRAMGDMQ